MVPISCPISFNYVDDKAKKERKDLPDDDKVVQKRKRDREKQLRCRTKKHYQGVIADLNKDDQYHQKQIAWYPKTEGSPLRISANVTRKRGLQLSEEGESRAYCARTKQKKVVVVKCKESDTPELIGVHQIRRNEPCNVKEIKMGQEKGHLATVVTGEFPLTVGGRSCVRLVMWPSGEYWWLQPDEIKPLVGETRKKDSTKFYWPGEEETCLDRKKSLKMDLKGGDAVFPVTGTPGDCLEEAMKVAKETVVFKNGSCDVSMAIKCGMSMIPKKIPSKKMKTMSEESIKTVEKLLDLSLTYSFLRQEGPNVRGKISAFDELLGADVSGDANYAKSLADLIAMKEHGGAVPALKLAVMNEGGGKQKRRKTPDKKCTNCKKRGARRKGLLCNPCFEALNPPAEGDKWCRVCGPFGYKNKPRQRGGRCSDCIRQGRQILTGGTCCG